MDEVDFTILAATSVLGDLIEKCPPAEACRDAFDRMSKATVQMCMSTTGFSSSAQGLNSRRRSHGPQDGNSNKEYFNSNNGKIRRSGGRPKPTFDMGLNDLLGPVQMSRDRPGSQTPTGQNVKNEYDFNNNSASNNNNNGNTRQTTGQSPRSTQQQQQQQNSPIHSDYAISPPFSSLDPAIDPSILPSHQSPSAYPNLPPTSQAQYANPNPNPTQSQSQNGYTQDMYNQNAFAAPGMDFLQGNGWDNGVDMNWAGGAGGDLGMAGLGWEGMDHDFSEGNGGLPDLFEGFFFGGAGNI